MPDSGSDEALVIDPADLAPGDRRWADFDFSGLTVHLIDRPEHPLFEPCYQKLWEEFSHHHAMEQQGVIIARLAWDPSRPTDRCSFLYRMIAICKDGVPVAVRDCTAMLHRQHPQQVYVHLSHALVDVDFRGGGLAAWLRALPLQIARQCHAAAGLGPASPPIITLVAEMDHPNPDDPMSLKRLRSYERAGFLKVDPAVIDYYQPDFRPAARIDASGGPAPVRFSLVLRRVAREHEREITGREVRLIVEALYHMYGVHFRPQDMSAAWKTLERYPPEDQTVQLVPPTL
ncbi:MAG: hypothetical protein NZ561_07245 [Phycisphaerae bacterium]|nr:hypothetical protein [Phycisphaerae bacterium]MDW8261003.1 hypothetical protein [Phycisphaerales bacterium]